MATITFPDGSQYAWIGAAASVDGNSDARRTGFQVHWPEFAQGQTDSLLDTD
ncbi:hypothetical protein GGS24DRAFT_504295 [Hypoxylon argillaceum]|nr:hypothetical protein GGS24DRAFT_504295 [Hypoxylon argillaceum]